MESSDDRSPRTDQVDAALDEIHQVRTRVLTQTPTPARCLQLAALADAEAAWWEVLSESSRTRVHWRAALAAREHAQHTARLWRHRATQLQNVAREATQPTPVGAVA